jgi:hypothetical protein
VRPLHWPTGFPLPAQSSWLDRLFNPYKSYTEVKKVLDAQLQARPRPDPSVWGDDPLRVRIGLLVCTRLLEEYEWRNDHFIPGDPFDIAFMIPWVDLEVGEVIMDLEGDLGIKIENEVAEAWSGRTLGYVVDTLLATCQAPSVD